MKDLLETDPVITDEGLEEIEARKNNTEETLMLINRIKADAILLDEIKAAYLQALDWAESLTEVIMENVDNLTDKQFEQVEEVRDKVFQFLEQKGLALPTQEEPSDLPN